MPMKKRERKRRFQEIAKMMNLKILEKKKQKSVTGIFGNEIGQINSEEKPCGTSVVQDIPLAGPSGIEKVPSEVDDMSFDMTAKSSNKELLSPTSTLGSATPCSSKFHSTSMPKKGRKRKERESEVMDKSVDDFEISDRGDDNDSILPSTPISQTKEEQALQTIINKVKQRLDIDEIRVCLEHFPTTSLEKSRERNRDESLSTISDEEPFEMNVDESPPNTEAIYYDFFIPKDVTKPLELSTQCKYDEALQSLLNVIVSEENEEPASNPDPTLPKFPIMDRNKYFNLQRVIAGYRPSLTSQESAIVQIKQLNDLQKKMGALCPFCDSATIVYKLRETRTQKFCPTLEGKCTYCNKILGHVPVHESVTLPGKSQRKADVICWKLCIESFESGIGYKALHKILSALNLPSISHHKFYQYLDDALDIVEGWGDKMNDQGAEIVKNYYLNLGVEMKEGMMNIPVSFIGTMLMRGDGSSIGLGFVVEVETGIILDYHVVSKYCNICTPLRKKQKNMTKEQIKAWKEDHKPNCQANYDKTKSLASMEEKVAEILFERSKMRNLRYTKILSDEDSSTFLHLQRLNPYGNEYRIKNENCLNHFCNEIYQRLVKLGEKHHLGGKGEGKLTKKTAAVFANFYRVFIKRYNENHTEIKKNVLASVFHHASTDEYPIHQLCPRGQKSWCKFQRDSSNGIEITSNWHREKNNRKFSLGYEAMNAVLGIMTTMITEEVLSIVTPKPHQKDITEDILSKIFAIVPKSKYVGPNQVKFAAARVSLLHNCGEKAANILKCLGLN